MIHSAPPQHALAMTMNNEAVETPEPMPHADGVPPPPAVVLRSLLDDPEPKKEAWQAQAGRAFSMVAVGFLNEPNDEMALHAVALLTLAQSLGVKEARKRAIKLSRWAERRPPPLMALSAKDEQRAALTALAKLTTAWSRPYAEQALADSALHDEFAPELLKWARTTFADTASFTRDFYAPQVAAARTSERAAFLLKDAYQLLQPLRPDAAVKLADTPAVLIRSFCQSLKFSVVGDKAFGSSVAALLHLVQDQAASMPALLLQPAFVMAVGCLSEVASKGAASKQVAVAAEAMSLATISLLMADVERAGKAATDHWRPMVPTWRSAYPRWDEHITAATAVAPAMADLAVEVVIEAPASPDAYASEAVFARLLPAWDAFVAELPDATRASSLSAMLRQAAETAGVESMGEKGDMVSYDPLSHHLTTEEAGAPSQVRIVRPGVQVRRADGSARVLVAALVAAV